jgi:hypothetical protein
VVITIVGTMTAGTVPVGIGAAIDCTLASGEGLNFVMPGSIATPYSAYAEIEFGRCLGSNDDIVAPFFLNRNNWWILLCGSNPGR